MNWKWLLLLPWAIDCSSGPICAITYKADQIGIVECHKGMSEDDCGWQKDFVDSMNTAYEWRTQRETLEPGVIHPPRSYNPCQDGDCKE